VVLALVGTGDAPITVGWRVIAMGKAFFASERKKTTPARKELLCKQKLSSFRS
jgi:hypothetical protein